MVIGSRPEVAEIPDGLGAALSKIEEEEMSPRLGGSCSALAGFLTRFEGFEGSRKSVLGFLRPRKRSRIERRHARGSVMDGRRWGWGGKGLRAVSRRGLV